MPPVEQLDVAPVFGDGPALRVAHLGPDPAGRGGMAAVMSALLNSELAARHQLDVIVTYREGSRFSRVAIFVRALMLLIRWCRGPGARVVHLHAAVRGSLVRKAICVMVARRLGRPVLLHFHGGGAEVEAGTAQASALRTRLLAAALGRADEIIAVSGVTAQAVERSFGVREVGVVPNPAPVPVARMTGRPDGPVRGLFLGGFADPVKGGAVLVSTLEDLLDESFELVFAGPGTPPRALLDWPHTTARWRGWLEGPEKAQALADADILVLPSLSEGLPVALLEGLANGLAVVASRVGGIPEVVDDERDALLVKPDDPRALVDALIRLIGDADLRRRLGEAAQARAGRLTATEVVDALDERYRRLAGQKQVQVARAGSPRKLNNRSPDAVFLSYHSIAEGGPAFLSLPPDTFERQLAQLRAGGYHSGAHAELRLLAQGEPLPRRTVFLTFDDGYRDTYDVARPLLESYRFRAIVFLLPTALSEGGPLCWPEVDSATRRWPHIMRSMTWEMAEEMAAAGHEFGAHTLTHPRLPEVDDEQLAYELGGSRARIAERLGTCASVAYPFGDCDDRVARAAGRAGFEFGFTLPFGAQRLASPLTIPRINIDHRDDRARFALKLSGPGRRMLLSPVKPALRLALRRERADARYAASYSA